MSNDELTPEEREALAHLPRERTPSAGLEDRVVAAMREHGHLARKPARVIRLTTSRVAGLLAACLVLMIGAYSIGLHRGVSDEVLTKVEPQVQSFSEQTASQEIEATRGAVKLGRVTGNEASKTVEPEADFVDKKAPPFEPPKLNVPQLASRKDAKEEKKAKADEVNEAMAQSFSDRLSAETSQPAGATDLAAPMSPPMASQMRPKAVLDESAEHWRSFALNSGTLIVDAPDSVRVETDGQGRTLLIYTSNGVIRVRLAD